MTYRHVYGDLGVVLNAVFPQPTCAPQLMVPVTVHTMFGLIFKSSVPANN